MIGMRGVMKMNNHILPRREIKKSYSGDYMKVGIIAENIIIKFLNSKSNILEIIDKRYDEEYQRKEIDIIIKMNDERIIKCEIKSDWHLGVSGKVLFEVLRINHNTLDPSYAVNIGWSARTEADEVLYYAPQVNSIYRVTVNKLITAMQEYTQEARTDTFINIVPTDNIKSTVNILIPWKPYCENIFNIYKLGGE